MFSTQPCENGADISWITTCRALPSLSGASVITSRSSGAMRTQSSGAAAAPISLGEGAGVSVCPTAELLESAASCAAQGAESASDEACDLSGLIIETLCQRNITYHRP